MIGLAKHASFAYAVPVHVSSLVSSACMNTVACSHSFAYIQKIRSLHKESIEMLFSHRRFDLFMLMFTFRLLSLSISLPLTNCFVSLLAFL